MYSATANCARARVAKGCPYDEAAYDMAELPEVDLHAGLRRDLHEAFALPGLADEKRGAKLLLGLAGLGGGFNCRRT